MAAVDFVVEFGRGQCDAPHWALYSGEGVQDQEGRGGFSFKYLIPKTTFSHSDGFLSFSLQTNLMNECSSASYATIVQGDNFPFFFFFSFLGYWGLNPEVLYH